MTGLYDWNPMPHLVDVRCPKCSEHAIFEFAEIVRIKRNEDLDFFQNSDQFEYQRFQDSCGHFWHGAIYFAGLHGNAKVVITDLPVGYDSSDWLHSKYWCRNHGTDLGSISCSNCGARSKHILNWPTDAYYSICYKKSVLWAFNRESAIELQEYLGSNSRDIAKHKWRGFLLHIPSIFKSHKARKDVTKLLGRLL